MPNRRRSHRSELPNPGCSQGSDPIETSGEFLPDGTVIELIRDPETCGLELLIFADGTRKTAQEFEHAGRRYRPLDLTASSAQIIPPPCGCAPYETTAKLFSDTASCYTQQGFSEAVAQACTYFGFATWFPHVDRPTPCLGISGPPAEALRLQQLLRSLVRRGFRTLDLTSISFRRIIGELRPTLLLDWRHLSQHSRRLLCASCTPGAHVVAPDSIIDFGMPRAIYFGAEPDPEFPGDFCLRVHLTPAKCGHSMLSENALGKICTNFQPRYLDYRLCNFAAVRDSEFDSPELQGESRIMAKLYGSCVVGAPELQAGMRALIDDRESELRESRFTDHTCVVIEVIFATCHDPKRQVMRVMELTDDVNAILKARGDTVQLKPRAVGAKLDKLRLRREPRNGFGRQILLNARAKRRIHELARDYKVESIQQQIPVCALCKEILGSNVDATEKTAARRPVERRA